MMKTTTRLPDVVPADLESALHALGITDLWVRGDEGTALCPNPEHFDNNPSWSINMDTGKGVRSGEAIAWIRTQKPRIGVAEEPVFQAQWQVHEADLYSFVDPPQDALDERQVTAEACRAQEVLFNEDKNEWVFPLRDPWNGRLIGWQTKGRGTNSSMVDN
jgi:hypothetical protein